MTAIWNLRGRGLVVPQASPGTTQGQLGDNSGTTQGLVGDCSRREKKSDPRRATYPQHSPEETLTSPPGVPRQTQAPGDIQTF